MRESQAPQYFGRDLEAMSFARNYHKWILDEFRPYLGTSVAEVGAGTGSFSSLVLETNVGSLKAFEPSQNMYPMLQATLGRDPRAEAINGFFAGASGESFDSILYVNVLEHVRDDASEMVMAREALSPGGHVLLFVPALSCLYSEFDRQVGHYRRYTRRGLADLAQRAGLRVVKSRYFDMAGIIPWYVNFVLLKNSMHGGSVSLYDKLVVPVTRTFEKVVRPPVGKNVLLVARKV